MYANIIAVDFFNNGDPEQNAYVGVDWDGHNRVVRYTFTAPASGGNNVVLKFTYNSLYGGTSENLRFFIGRDPDSHKNAGASSSYTGILVFGGGNTNGHNGSADVMLIPGQVYYLFVFPSVTTYSLWAWQGTVGNEWNTFASVDVSGSVGGANIGDGYYTTYIGNESYVPYMGGADGSWKLLS